MVSGLVGPIIFVSLEQFILPACHIETERNTSIPPSIKVRRFQTIFLLSGQQQPVEPLRCHGYEGDSLIKMNKGPEGFRNPDPIET